MSIEPYKYMIQAVAIERDESGRIVAERAAEVLTVFSAEQAAEAVAAFEAQLKEMNMSKNGDRPENHEEER